jgi:hypothetical protein
MSSYANTFRALQPAYDPRHIEGYVRLQYATLDHLSLAELRGEAHVAVACIEEAGLEAAESLAVSFGL